MLQTVDIKATCLYQISLVIGDKQFFIHAYELHQDKRTSNIYKFVYEPNL